MASRGRKRVTVDKVEAPKPKRGRPPARKPDHVEEMTPKKVKTDKPSRITPPRRAKGGRSDNRRRSPTPPRVNGSSSTPKTSSKRSTLGMKMTTVKPKKAVRPAKSSTPVPPATPEARSEDEDDTEAEPTASQKAVTEVRSKIRNILKKSEEEEAAIIDSDDAISDGGNDVQNYSQRTMEGSIDYTEHPNGSEEEEELEQPTHPDNGEGDSSDNDDPESVNVSKMQMVHQTSVFDDPTKKHEEWWSEDPTREETLCDLWREEQSLYNMSVTGHRVPANKAGILKKFSLILQVPPAIIYTRMQSIRNQYQKLHREAKSGSEPVGKTPRQREILRLVPFLRTHIKTSESLTSYVRSPSVKYSYQVKAVTPRKQHQKKTTPPPASPLGEPVPKPTTFNALKKGFEGIVELGEKLVVLKKQRDAEENDEKVEDAGPRQPKVSSMLNQSLTPIGRPPSLTTSELGDGSESEFVVNNKHFSRNDRLHDAKTNDASVRRSLRLSPVRNPQMKKTNDYTKVKSSKAKPSASAGRNPAQSSCHDTAEKAPSKSSKCVNKEKELLHVEHTVDNRRHHVQDNPAPKKQQLTAAQRKQQYLKSRHEEEEADVRHPVPKASTSTKDNKQQEKANAAERRKAMASTSTDGQYDISLEASWYDKQGPTYRKTREEQRRDKEKEKDTGLQQVMKEKAASMRLLTESVNLMARKPAATAAAPAVHESAEQLWCDSLVPHLQRMDIGRRDKFMVHVLGLAFQCIRGSWPTDDDMM